MRTQAIAVLCVLAGILPAGCGSDGAKKTIETDASIEDREVAAETAPDSAAGEASRDVVDVYMDRQAEELGGIDGVTAEREGETIRMTWDSTVLFGFDSAMLMAAAQPRIDQMADILIRYPETRIIISGHTDTKGDEDYNFTLSERRALSVRNYLIDAGVSPARIKTVGYGEFRPIAPNDTEEGRRINRRVEIEIHPDDALKSRAARADSAR